MTMKCFFERQMTQSLCQGFQFCYSVFTWLASQCWSASSREPSTRPLKHRGTTLNFQSTPRKLMLHGSQRPHLCLRIFEIPGRNQFNSNQIHLYFHSSMRNIDSNMCNGIRPNVSKFITVNVHVINEISRLDKQAYNKNKQKGRHWLLLVF